MRRRLLRWMAAATLAAVSSASVALDERQLTVNGVNRTYFLNVPTNRPANPALVLAFHGGPSSGEKFSRRTQLEPVSNRHGFILVFPNSTGYWHDGRRETGNSRNDLMFVEGIIDDLQARYSIDRERVYATGASNGGMFTLRIGCELGHLIAAVAPVIASFPADYVNQCRPAKPIPILMINGTEDRFIKWQGGEIPKGGRKGAGGRTVPVLQTFQFWQQNNRCSKETSVTGVPDRDPSDATRSELMEFRACSPRAPVRLIRVNGGGHTWPGIARSGARKRIADRIAGLTSTDFNAGEEIWQFVSRFRLN